MAGHGTPPGSRGGALNVPTDRNGQEGGPEALSGPERSIEERLRGMSERGELGRLPGEGQPLPLEGDDGPWWAAFHVMKQNRVLPQWAEMRKDIDAESERLLARVRRHLAWVDRRAADLRRLPAERIIEAVRLTREEEGRSRERLRASASAHNARIERYNAVVPVDSLRLPPVTLDGLFAAARASTDGRPKGDAG